MITALWIIAICQLIRLIQNTIQLIALFTRSDEKQVKRATDAFIESLKAEMEREGKDVDNFKGH